MSGMKNLCEALVSRTGNITVECSLTIGTVRLCLSRVGTTGIHTCRLFEPYIVQLMGKLLERFGDPSASVRHATNGVARAVMANLSSQGDILQTFL